MSNVLLLFPAYILAYTCERWFIPVSPWH